MNTTTNLFYITISTTFIIKKQNTYMNSKQQKTKWATFIYDNKEGRSQNFFKTQNTIGSILRHINITKAASTK